MTVLITLPIAGPSTGPFSLYSDVDGYTSPFEIQVPKPLLVAGYTSILVPAGTTIIQVRSLGTCTNSINLPINLLGTSTTTTSTSTTTAPTTTTTTVPTTTSSTTTSTSTTTVPTTTSSTTTTTVPILECVELTNNIVTTQQTCLGTPYDLKLGTITLDLVDSLGAPSIATNDVTVTLSFQTRQCGDSAPVPTTVPVTILTGTSSITHSYTREQTTDCGQGACEVEYDIFQSVVSVEPSLKYAMCNVGSSTTTTSTTSTSTTTVPTTTSTTTSTTTVAPTTSTTTTTIPGGITVPQGSQITFPGPNSCTEITVTTYFTDGGGTLIERGICYNTTGNPSIADSKFIGATVEGFQTVLVTGLIPDTNYYWRGYAINEVGTGYYATVTMSPTGWYLATEPCISTTTEAPTTTSTTTSSTTAPTTTTTTTQGGQACTELEIYPPLTPGTTHTVVFLTCEYGTQETINIPYGGTMGAICVQPGGVISDNGASVNAQTYATFMPCIGNTTTTTTTTTTPPPANNYSFFRCSGSGIASVVVSEASLISAGMTPGTILNGLETIEITGSGNLGSCYSFDDMTSASLTGVGVVSFNQCDCLSPA